MQELNECSYAWKPYWSSLYKRYFPDGSFLPLVLVLPMIIIVVVVIVIVVGRYRDHHLLPFLVINYQST